MEYKTNGTRRVKSLLLALAMLLSCAALPSDRALAAEKELTGGTVDVIRWHRGLPPRDGNWYRVIISNGTRFIRGNSVQQCDDYDGSIQTVLNSTYRWRVVGKHNWNHYDNGQFVDMPREETLLSANNLDLSMDMFYTETYMNTPAIRYNNRGGSAKNGCEPLRGDAPTYDIRLCDWTRGDGVLTNETLFCEPFSGSLFGEVFGETVNAVVKLAEFMMVGVGTVLLSDLTDKAGHGIAELFGDNLRTMVVTEGLDVTTPWAFVGNEHDDEVDEGKYVITIKADHKSGLFHDIYLEYPNKIFTCVFGLYGTWAGSDEYTIYWGETVHLDTIGGNESIGNGTVVNLNTAGDRNNYLRIAPGMTLTVEDGGILSVGTGVFNDGTIKIKKGGTLIVKEGAYVGPKEYGQKLGNIVCEGGDVVVMPGAKIYLEGAAGLKLSDDAHLVNNGLIVTWYGEMPGSVVENYGALYLRSGVKADQKGTFMDYAPVISADGSCRWPGATGEPILILSGRSAYTMMVGYRSVWKGSYANIASN